MIATIVTAVLCGCCALFTCILGVGGLTGNGTLSLGNSNQPMPPALGAVFLCLSLIMILVPVGVGFFTLRKKPEADAEEPQPTDLPPAS
jgi:hypothetical protein